ncbi:MAG TPA: alpha-2-macroglobulin family protein, partial [Pyrinomonadaceae bacterium]|nr:alpha-2-macroglobulin family protein [Pyrinomonadaceae bacterium]
VSFDQEINAEAVLRTIKVTAGGKTLPIRLATQQEIESDSSISYYAKQAQPKRWLAFRAVTNENLTENALPSASAITVTIEKGTASAEGPLTTTQPQTFTFQTYSQLKFSGGYCGWRENKNCTPFEVWYMEFNNQLDTTNFTKEMVKIEPAVEGLNIYPSGNYIYIQGYKKGRTTYKVTVDGSLKDIYGQTLGTPATATIRVGSAEQSLYSQGGSMILLDPTAKPAYSIYSTNHASVKVRIYSVQPTDWQQFQGYLRRINYDDDKQKPMIPGKLVSDKIVQIKNTPDELVETRIDLSEFLDGGFGHLILDIEPTARRNQYDRTRIFTWAQATNIGLDAFVDNQELVGFATELKTGKPLSGVELAIYPNGKAISGHPTGVGEQQTAESGQSWWEWLTNWGTSDDSIKETQTISENGEISETETIENAQTNNTTANGILRLPLPDAQPQKQNLLIAKKGKDIAFLPEQTDYYWQESGSWFKKTPTDSLRWFTFDDRKMYRPKEEVAVKGYIRRITAGKFGDVEPLGDVGGAITYSVKDSRNNEIAKGTTNLNAFGAFDFKFLLPDNMNLGQGYVEISGAGSSTQHYFQVQEFRRPEFEVTAKVETEAPHFVGNSANVSVEAKYYAGGGLANADANWTVTANPTNYTPPNRDDYTFGTWTPWWNFRGYDYESDGGYRGGGTSQSFKGVTDASGRHLLKIDFESVKPPRPYNVTAQVSVQDVNRQTFASSTNLLVHAADLYVGIRSPRTFVQKGETIEIESIVSDIDGKLIANRDVEIKAVLKDWTFDKGAWIEKAIDEQTCNIKSADKGVTCKFTAKAGGRYTITASVMDDRERFNESEITIWVAGGKTVPKRNVEQEEAQIIPNKKEYAANETAEILVLAPFTPAEGVLTLRREGLVKTERFSMKESSIILRIPLEERYLPNITAQVDLVGSTPRTNDKGEVDAKLANRPAFATGAINLPISTDSRKLNVSAEPEAKTLEPAGETKINIAVTDKNGEPVANSEVAVVVVDESVLALTGYQLANPMSVFYTARAAGVTDYHLRKDILLGNPDDIKSPPPPPVPSSQMMVESQSSIVGGATAAPKSVMARTAKNEARADMAMAESVSDDNQSREQINLRENFNALAVFAPSVKTDSNGKAVVPIKLPDNLTRYRIMAVSVDTGKRFGKGESNITAKQPLMVRPSAPRFMNFGDKIELPVVVQNQTDKALTVDVAVRATNANLTNGGGRKVVIPANDRAEIRFPVNADKAGTARFQIAATSGRFTDAAEISLPVWTPATTEAFATYGTTDRNGAIIQPIEAPKDVFSQFGG